MKKFIILGCFMTIATLVSGCSNTFDGAGRDISRAGDKISDTF